MEDFIQNLAVVDDLWAKVTSLGKRYVCRSKISEDNKQWELSCINLGTGNDQVWRALYAFNDVAKMKHSIGREAETQLSWKVYFDLFKKSFSKDEIFVSLETESVVLTVWCSYSDGTTSKQLSYNFDLGIAKGDDVAHSDRYPLFIFSMVDKIRNSTSKVHDSNDEYNRNTFTQLHSMDTKFLSSTYAQSQSALDQSGNIFRSQIRIDN
eukprot:TRINITY_DN5946_c0_g1_i3.p1 TRINITY_DN5946_c0_g1~~TRINITY_DN5946_c0_g1_i3.p1  ORF type:complete len:209 (+),score=28.67 TRINITY_DN5946_c0_g1_i3:20-646(+)